MHFYVRIHDAWVRNLVCSKEALNVDVIHAEYVNTKRGFSYLNGIYSMLKAYTRSWFSRSVLWAYWCYFPSAKEDGLIITLNLK